MWMWEPQEDAKNNVKCAVAVAAALRDLLARPAGGLVNESE